MKYIAIIFILTLVSGKVFAQETAVDKSRNQTGRNTYALIVGGISKEQQDRSDKSRILSVLQKFLFDNPEIGPKNLNVLMPEDSSANGSSGISNAENIQEAIANIKTAVMPEDRFIFYYIGQANIIGEKLRFNLPGADITQEQLAQWIKGIQASSMLIVLDCPGAGLAAKALSGRGRVVICSCTAEQRYSTRLSEYFIPALSDSNTDANTDGKISILEAFTAASRQIDDWYRQEKLLTTETPVLEDNGDGLPSKEPWRYKIDRTDGLAASEFFLLRQ